MKPIHKVSTYSAGHSPYKPVLETGFLLLIKEKKRMYKMVIILVLLLVIPYIQCSKLVDEFTNFEGL